MKWSNLLSMSLWPCLFVVLLALLATLVATLMLRALVLWIARRLLNARQAKLKKLQDRMRRYPPDLKSPALESRPFIAKKPWR
jgi:hypothetical protein